MTTDGKPAKSSMAGLMYSRIRFEAKVAVNKAAKIPKGAANSIEISVIFNVPIMRGHNPKRGLSDTGCQSFPPRVFRGDDSSLLST